MIILGTNSVKDTGGYQVDNSCRFNVGSSDYLNRTQGTATSAKIFTLSMWVKISTLGEAVFFSSYYNSTNRFQIYFNANGTLTILNKSSGSTNINVQTNRVFRDTSAFYNIVYEIDTTNATADDRIKLYVNGVQETSFSTATYPSENDNISISGSNYILNLGRYGGTGSHFGGYMSEVVFVDGTAQANTDLGEFDEDSSIWKPIDVSGLTFGNNGFYQEYKQSGTGTDSSGMGADTSGNDNHFAVNNLTAVDQSTDTCTNNFATLNPLHSIGAASELSQGNLEYDPSGHHRIISTIAPSSGKWYAEVKGIDNPDKFNAGVAHYPMPANGSASSFAFGQGVNADVGRFANDFGIKANGDYGNNNSYSSYMASLEGENNNIVGIYMDLDNYKLYFSKNGSLVSSTGKDLTNNGEPYGFISVGEAATFQWNFGNPSFAISSGNTDGEYGNFEYSTTITGDGASKTFKALCTKNLAEYG